MSPLPEARCADDGAANDQGRSRRQRPCPSTWQVIGSDNFDSIVGSRLTALVFSEWAHANPAAWAYLSPILEENGGWAMFTPRRAARTPAIRSISAGSRPMDGLPFCKA